MYIILNDETITNSKYWNIFSRLYLKKYCCTNQNTILFNHCFREGLARVALPNALLRLKLEGLIEPFGNASIPIILYSQKLPHTGIFIPNQLVRLQEEIVIRFYTNNQRKLFCPPGSVIFSFQILSESDYYDFIPDLLESKNLDETVVFETQTRFPHIKRPETGYFL